MEGQTRQKRHKTQRKQKTLPKEENQHYSWVLIYENLTKQKQGKQKQESTQAMKIIYTVNLQKVQQKALQKEENKGYEKG